MNIAYSKLNEILFSYWTFVSSIYLVVSWNQAFAQDLSCLSLWQVKILNDSCHLQWQVNTNSHLSIFWQNIFVLYEWILLHVCILQYKLGNSPRQSSMAQYYLYITPVSSNTKYLLVNNSQNITREARTRAYCLSCPKRARAHLHRSPVHPAQKLIWIFSEFLIM